MTTLHVDSEVSPLRRVLLHRPGLELQRLTPRNCDELLFDDGQRTTPQAAGGDG